MTFTEKFEKLKKKFDKAKNPTFAEDFAIQINMTDSDCGGAFYVAFLDGVFAVEPYDYHDNTAMLTLESKVLESLITGKTTTADALNDGNIDIIGNPDHVANLFTTIAKANKRTATKKTTAKKSAKTGAKAEEKAETKAESKKTAKKSTKKAEPKKATTKKAPAKKDDKAE